MNCILAFGPEGFDATRADMVVSLSPEASLFFGSQRISYRRMDEFYDEKELFGEENSKKYFKSQTKFMAETDAFFQRHSRLCRETGVPLCSINYLRIKYAMDTVNINGWVLERFFDANPGIRSVTLLLGRPREGEESPSFFSFRSSRKAVYAKVLERVCSMRNIACAVRPSAGAGSEPAPVRTHFRETVRLTLKTLSRYISYRKFGRRPISSTSLFFLHSGASEIDHFIRQAIFRGIRAFVRTRDALVLENSAFRPEFAVNLPAESLELSDELRRCAEDMTEGEEWIFRLNAACLWDGASEVLRPLFARYAQNEAYRILSDAFAWKRCMEENRIDAVIARGNTDPDSLSILIAARHLCSKKTICVQHAPSALQGEAMSLYDTAGFDYVLAKDPVTYAYFKASNREESRLGWSAHYLKRLRGAHKGRRRGSGTIAYLPKKFHEDVRCFNEYSYPFVWYYEWQKNIMDLFAKLRPHSFAYKHVPVQDWASRSIVPYIRALDADNIQVVDAPFSEILDRFDRVITDYPSGGFFESLACGKSVLCLHPTYFQINHEAKRLFGQCFAPFDTIEQSLAAIEKFVRSDADAYRAELPLQEMDIERLVSKALAAPARHTAAVVAGI